MPRRATNWQVDFWQRVDVMMADATDEDLADLKPMALARLPESARGMYADKLVRECRTLRRLVYEVLTEAGRKR